MEVRTTDAADADPHSDLPGSGFWNFSFHERERMGGYRARDIDGPSPHLLCCHGSLPFPTRSTISPPGHLSTASSTAEELCVENDPASARRSRQDAHALLAGQAM